MCKIWKRVMKSVHDIGLVYSSDGGAVVVAGILEGILGHPHGRIIRDEFDALNNSINNL